MCQRDICRGYLDFLALLLNEGDAWFDIILSDNLWAWAIDLIDKKPGITQEEITGELKIVQQKISYNLLKLVEKGKIRIEKTGRIKHYYPLKIDASSA